MTALSKVGQGLLNLLFPPKCVFCRSLLGKDEVDICGACRLKLPIFSGAERKSPYFFGFTAVFYYEGQVRESLHRYKFRGMTHYAPAYGALLAAAVTGKLPGSFDVVSWCPVSTKRRKKRGYDQSELLARELAARLGLPAVQTLHKTRDNPAQSAARDVQARRANVLGVYGARPEPSWTGRRILLVDDIATSGATLQEASRVLLTAGAAEVCCAVMATIREQ